MAEEGELENLVDAFIASIPEQVERSAVQAAAKGDDSVAVPIELLKDGAESDQVLLSKLVHDMTIPQKIKLALFGNQTARALLIRDTNRQIPMFVLQNGRLNESEIFDFARNTNLTDQVLRAISSNSEWMKNYATRVAIVSNPKTPIDASLKWIKYLQPADLRRLSKSKNIPQTIATQCRKLSETKKV